MNKLYKRIISLSLFAICFTSSLYTFAQDTTTLTLNPGQPTTETTTGITPLPTNVTPFNLPAPPILEASSYVLLDTNSGKVLAEKNVDIRVPPASLTKIMTLYIISDSLKRGLIHLDDPVHVSEKAWRTGGSRMFIKVGDQVKVSDLIKGIVITSGNDACVAMAEHIAGSEESFADLMNQHAQHLGMKNTHFTDSTGMPADNHYTTAYDMAILGRALIKDFPEFYPWYKEKEFTYNNIEQYNRNRLLWSDPSVDGIKTGHTDNAGFCLVASAKRGDMRLISVVMNAKSPTQREESSLKLMNYGFRFYTSQKLYAPMQPLAKARIWYGQNKQIAVGLNEELVLTLPVTQYKQLKANVVLPRDLKAPIQKGQIIGNLNIMLQDKLLTSVPVVALENSPRSGWYQCVSDSVSLFFHRWFNDSPPTVDNG